MAGAATGVAAAATGVAAAPGVPPMATKTPQPPKTPPPGWLAARPIPVQLPEAALQSALRAALEANQDTLERMHQEQKANTKVTETLLAQVAKVSKPKGGKGKGHEKWNWRPPRLCFGCHKITYLGADFGCANPNCIINTVDQGKRATAQPRRDEGQGSSSSQEWQQGQTWRQQQ